MAPGAHIPKKKKELHKYLLCLYLWRESVRGFLRVYQAERGPVSLTGLFSRTPTKGSMAWMGTHVTSSWFLLEA